MKILRTYILKECLLPFVITLSVLTSIFLIGYLPQLADKVINKGFSLRTVGQVFIYFIPLSIGYTLPIACLATIILTFGRMSADNEILAMRASGIRLDKVLAPLFVVGIVFSLLLLILNDRIITRAYGQQRMLLKDTSTQNPASLLEPGVFIHAFEGQIIFIYRIDGNKLSGIRIYQPQPDGKPTRTIIAQEGEFAPSPSGDQIKLKLVNGTSDEIDFKNPNSFYKLNFDTSFITLDMSKGKKKNEKKPKAMTLAEIKDEVESLGIHFIDASPYMAEYHRKIAWSFTPLIFILLGFPIAVITHKRGKTANLMWVFGFTFLYYSSSMGCHAVAKENILPPAIMMWVPNAVAGIVVCFLNFRLCRS